jgi:undecaprenyl-diphosphatase
MTIIQSIFLGILQGITEFLPVSSSGHLVLAKALLGIDTGKDISFEVFVHFGTLVSVLVVFRKDIAEIGHVLLGARPREWPRLYRESPVFRLAVFILVGCLPAGIVGVLFNDVIEEFFTDPKLVADMLIVTSVILYLTRFARPDPSGDVTLGSAIGIGLAQTVAIIPGISRAGSTISCGVFLGVPQERAARFSFLMAVPVIFGATLLKTRDLLQQPPPVSTLVTLLAGTLVAAVSGYLALRLLLSILKRGRLSLFAYYCFVVGVLGILFIE